MFGLKVYEERVQSKRTCPKKERSSQGKKRSGQHRNLAIFVSRKERQTERTRERKKGGERNSSHFPFSLASWLAPFLVSPPQLVYGGEEHPFLLIAFLFDVFERERAREELELGFLLVRGKKDAYDEATQKHCVGSIFSFRSCQYFIIYLV